MRNNQGRSAAPISTPMAVSGGAAGNLPGSAPVPASAAAAPPASPAWNGATEAGSVQTHSGEWKKWSAVSKDERLDVSALLPVHWFECFEQKERGQKRLTRQMLVFQNGVALMNGNKFKWYRPHLLLNKMLVGDDEDDLLVLRFGVGTVADFTTDTAISARLLMSNREEVMNALHRSRMVIQGEQAQPQTAPRAPGASSMQPQHGIRGPPAAVPPPIAPPVDASAYESVIGQASLLGYSEANVREAARQLQTERKPPDLNALLDRLERL